LLNKTRCLRFFDPTVKDDTVEWQWFLPFSYQVEGVVDAIQCVGQYNAALGSKIKYSVSMASSHLLLTLWKPVHVYTARHL